jgi:ABC-type lipoprotein release transport system permease subunit
MVSKGVPLLLLIFLLLLVPTQLPAQGQNTVTIDGTVKEHSTGKPFPHAKLLVILWRDMFQGEADSNGYFHLEFPAGTYVYSIYAYYDDPATTGFDYVPAMRNINTRGGRYNLTLDLWDGASMFFDREALFVQDTGVSSPIYTVLWPDAGAILYGEYEFEYDEYSSHYKIPGVSPKHIIVPANTPFMVMVSDQQGTNSFIIDKPDHFLLAKGEAVHVDLQEYSLPASLSVVKEDASETEIALEEKEAEGFYVAVERQRLSQVAIAIAEAEDFLSQRAYETSFERLRYAYVELQNLQNWLSSMHGEAVTSVFILVIFLALTSVTASSILFEERRKKIGGASLLYALLLAAFYVLYPGSRLVDTSLLLVASLISLSVVLVLATWLPSFLKGRAVRGRMPMWNLVVPLFSMAKRSLRRRRLRSVLTFATVTVLVSSFIALTSFSTGYGLTFSQVSSEPGPSKAILVRSPKPLTPPMYNKSYLYEFGDNPWDVYWYPPLENSSIGWFEERPETILVAPKMENLPFPFSGGVPLAYIERERINGIIGIIPSIESKILPWNETIVEGRFLNDGDDNGVLISSGLRERLNITVGETLTLQPVYADTNVRLKVVGILDDKKFGGLNDLDGQSLIPWKLKVELIIEEAVYYVKKELTPCSTNETIVVTYRTASEFEWMHLTRLNILCREEEDLKEYAKEMALERGFRVWASTEDGVYLAELAPYFEGKGLPIAVPWGMVVVNVVVTMLNSLYERRREINIYSSVGMSPSHISALFLVEAAMIGVIGGGIGYLLGLGWYKVMAFFSLALQVRQKVSAVWVLGAIAIAMTAVLAGGYAAIKGSTVITPSLRRKWSAGRSLNAEMAPLELTLPVMITEEEVEGFVEYVLRKLRSLTNDVDYVTSLIKTSHEEKDGSSIRTIEFYYKPTVSATTIHTSNKIILTREKEKEAYTIKLISLGQAKGVERVANLVRQTIIEWSIERGKRGVGAPGEE